MALHIWGQGTRPARARGDAHDYARPSAGDYSAAAGARRTRHPNAACRHAHCLSSERSLCSRAARGGGDATNCVMKATATAGSKDRPQLRAPRTTRQCSGTTATAATWSARPLCHTGATSSARPRGPRLSRAPVNAFARQRIALPVRFVRDHAASRLVKACASRTCASRACASRTGLPSAARGAAGHTCVRVAGNISHLRRSCA